MSSNKKTLYVGGLADDVDVNLLKSAFLPFGDIVDVSLPLDYSKQKHKGFAFIEFQLPEDAADAIDNMDNGELLGKTIRVNLARPMKFKESNNKPIWADDEYLQKIQEEAARDNSPKREDNEPEGTTVDDTGDVNVGSGDDDSSSSNESK